MSSSPEDSEKGHPEKMAGGSDFLGDKVDRNVPYELLRETRSYASVGNQQGIMKTHCNPLEFCNVVSNLSTAKLKAVKEMGLGYLQELKLDALHGSVWTTMVKGVDVNNSTVRIGGMNYPLTAENFTRCTGIADGYRDVVLGEKPAEVGDGFIKSYMCDSNGKLQISALIEVIRDREEADDFFKIAYFMYAINRIICPGMDAEVDTRLLPCLIRATLLNDFNWSSYAVNFLIEGVQMHRDMQTEVVPGCMVFMELLYLDVVAEAMDVVDRSLVPISSWATEDAKEVIKQWRKRGGFSSPLVLTKQSKRVKTLSGFVNCDGTVGIGIDRAIHEDVYEVKAGVSCANRNISGLVNMCGEFVPEIVEIKEMLAEIKEELQLRDERKGGREDKRASDSHNIAGKPSRFSDGVRRKEDNRTCSGQARLLVDRKKPHCARRLSMDHKTPRGTPTKDAGRALSETSSSPGPPPGKLKVNTGTRGPIQRYQIPKAHVRMMQNNAYKNTSLPDDTQRFQLPTAHPTTEGHPPELVQQNRFIVGPYQLRRPVPPTDVRLINYEFLGGRVTSHEENNARMAQCGEGRQTLHRDTMRRLGPGTNIDDQIINYACEFLSRDNPNSWFLPCGVSNYASTRRYFKRHELEFIERTRNVCNLFRFDGRLDTCNLIFVPIHVGCPGTQDGHWWLLVIDRRRQVAEIWDSIFVGQLSESIGTAFDVLHHLEELFGEDFRQYRIVTAPNAPIQPNGFDCGIFVIMHMMFYGTVWWLDFHSDEIRSGLMLQYMKSPASDIHDEVRQMADNYHFGRAQPRLPPAAVESPEEGTRTDDVVILTQVNPTVPRDLSPVVTDVLLQRTSEADMTTIEQHEGDFWGDWLDE